MADRLYRTQVLLKPEQHAELAQIARQEGRSVSDIIRELLDQQLTIRKQEADANWQRELEVFDRIQKHREAILARRDGLPLDLNVVEILDQLREEADDHAFGALANTGD